MNREIILSCFLIFSVVAISGCSAGNTAKENTTRYYDTVDVSFQYPADWTISEELTIEGEGVSGKIQTVHLVEGESFDEYVNLTKPSPPYIQKEGFVDIGGHEIYQVEAFNDGINYYQSYYPEKDGKITSIILKASEGVNATEGYHLILETFSEHF
ncbi:MAG: hypothetical protein ABFC91_04650 [Methanobacteriaceae archaeon]